MNGWNREIFGKLEMKEKKVKVECLRGFGDLFPV